MSRRFTRERKRSGRPHRSPRRDFPNVRRLHDPHDALPQTHLLSNGRYSVMLTGAGSGYSRWGDIGVTRWREDVTRDDHGSYLFLRDMMSGAVWSAGYQPCGIEPQSYQVTFTEDRAEFIRTDGAITTTLEIVVSPEDDAEVRRLSIANTGHRDRELEVTSYLELVLAPPAADAAHQTFSKLFVQTEYVDKRNTLLATRRKRSPGEPEIWAAHHAVVDGNALAEPEIETDRARFLGRGREIRSPLAVMDGHRLSGTVGTVLDPVFALRYRILVTAGTTARIAFWTGIASSREAVLDLLDKHHEDNSFERAATLAWTQAQVQLRHLGIDSAEAGLFQRLAGHLLYADGSMRPPSTAIRDGSGPPAGLWALRISGDVPILLLRIDAIEDIAIARQLLQAHEYWQMKGLAVDLVILNDRAASYVQDLQNALETQARMTQSQPPSAAHGARGSVFVLRTDLISEQSRNLLSAVARVVLVARRGGISDQLDRTRKPVMPVSAPPRSVPKTEPASGAGSGGDLEFFNGLGGFDAQGREYVTILAPGQSTPAPWINVIANPHFGFQVAADGGGFTWSLNSREHQITPWSNDPVADRPGEALYLRDEETGEVWGPTAAPIRDPGATYIARHGYGYSRFELSARDIELNLCMFVPMDDPIKISLLKIRNTSKRPRRLAITAYTEWVLGTARGTAAPFIVTELDALTGALFAHNPWDATFGSRIAFADLGGRQSQWTADRTEFLGRHGTLEMPAAMASRIPLSGHAGAGLDPCCALRTSIALEPGETMQVVSFLGEAEDAATARSLLTRYRAADLDAALKDVYRSLAGHSRWRPGQNAGSLLGHPPQRLVALSDSRLPHLGEIGVLSGERRLRLSRSAPGRHGGGRRQTGSHTRAPAARRRPAIHRGGRAALVVAAGHRRRDRPGRAHPHQRRCGLARLLCPAIPRHHRRCGRARREGRVSRGPRAAARGTRRVLHAGHLGGDRNPVRALRASARSRTADRRARPAAVRDRRLERWHEPGRREGPG